LFCDVHFVFDLFSLIFNGLDKLVELSSVAFSLFDGIGSAKEKRIA